MRRNLLKISVGLLLISAIAIGIISRKHPIILKWLAGSARIIGRPRKATIYTNGQANDNIKIYKVGTYWDGEEADYYLLHFTLTDTENTSKIISLNLDANYVGRPSSINKMDYDILFGMLFQSEVGAHFSTFTDDMKGYGFDPMLMFREQQIKLNVSPISKDLLCDSIRVEL